VTFELNQAVLTAAGSTLSHYCHGAARASGWWDGTDIADRNMVPAKLMLIVSEVAEAMEGHRRGRQDDHLPHRPMIEVELADAIIRIADLAGALGLDLGGAIAEKMSYNASRADHRPENRAKEGGKSY
jgi:NTP pyrophosphatase (non-canonical NTP hydrolase)